MPTSTVHSQAALVSGGKKPVTKSPIAAAAWPVNSCDQSMPSNCQLATMAADTASSTAALRQPQGAARGAGVASRARRKPFDSASAPSTSSTNTSRMEQASPPLSIFIAWSISWPRPPAPTKPMTTDARMAHSQR